MRWEKKGRIFTAANQHEWMAHHASVPNADKVDDRVLRIYFGPRDRQGRTRPAFVDVEADNPANVSTSTTVRARLGKTRHLRR